MIDDLGWLSLRDLSLTAQTRKRGPDGRAGSTVSAPLTTHGVVHPRGSSGHADPHHGLRPKPKLVENRNRWDVTVEDVAPLVGAGAILPREPDDTNWHVLVDPEGKREWSSDAAGSIALAPRTSATCPLHDAEVSAVTRACEPYEPWGMATDPGR